MKFSELAILPALVQVTEELGYKNLTPIQEQSIPLLLAGRDVIGESQTGSGKTAAFTLPILQKINVKRRVVQALILCPTRELCDQVAREMRKLARHLPGLQVLPLAGGQPARPQMFALEKGAHIAVGTPGRVLDLLNREALDLAGVKTVVLDEADRMLDMGFRDDMDSILRFAPVKRQTALFSATYPITIAALSKSYQTDPEHIKIAGEGRKAPAIQHVVHAAATADKKFAVLRALLLHHLPESAIIFCNQKAIVSEVTTALKKAKISATGLHGDLEQFDRDRVMAKFRNKSVRYLVATDVAARGIDVEGLDAVINYDLPSLPDVYVHRVGRTGRAGKKGLAISLATAKEGFKLEKIGETMGQPFKITSLPGEAESRSAGIELRAAMRTLYIAAGRKDKLRPGDVLGALTGVEAGALTGDSVGKIEVHDRYCYVAVVAELAHQALRKLSDGRVKGRKLNVELID